MKKIYKVSISARILFLGLSLLILTSEFIFPDVSISQRLLSLFLILFFMLGFFLLSKLKIIVDDDKIEFKGGVRSNSLKWEEIGELNSLYVLFPESPIITLRPRSGISKKPIEFMLFGMTLDLLKDILSHIPSDTKVYLYTRIKRQLEGKQTLFFKKQEWHETDFKHIKYNLHNYTNRQIIIIAILLALVIIGVFLFSLFVWK